MYSHLAALLHAVVACSTVLSSARAAPQDLRGEIEVGVARAFTVSPSGEIWIGSRDGKLFVSRDWNLSWSEVPLATRPQNEFGFGGDQLELLRFFDEKRAILAGWIGGEERNEILRSEDGGQNWTTVGLPQGLWVHDAQTTADGRAWLVGSTGKLLASEDFGASWRIAGEPFDTTLRSRSVCFVSPETGYVGANANGLALTRDGGRTWSRLATPADVIPPEEGKWDMEGGNVFRDLPAGPQDELEGVWVLGDRLLAFQGHALYQRPLASEKEWRSVEVAGRKVVSVERSPEGLVAIDEERRVHLLSSALERIGGSREPMASAPVAIAAERRGVAFLAHRRGKVCVLDGDELACSAMHTVGPNRSWPIAAFDRTTDGTLFGVSSTALFRSLEAGLTWERLAEGSRFDAVLAAADGASAVVRSSDGLLLWRKGSTSLEPIRVDEAGEQRLEFGARRGRVWVATSFLAADDEKTQKMLRTSDTVRKGPGFTALVVASADEGLTWRQVDRYVGATVHALWLGSDDVVSVCMSDGAIRRARLDPSDEARWPAELDTVAPSGLGLGGQWASWIAFPQSQRGIAGGRKYFGGAVLHETFDGGATWLAAAKPSEDVIETYLLGGGSCVRVAGFWRGSTRVEAWRADGFEEIFRFDVPVHDANVDAAGGLLVRLMDSDVWRLTADGKDWERVGKIQIPPR